MIFNRTRSRSRGGRRSADQTPDSNDWFTNANGWQCRTGSCKKLNLALLMVRAKMPYLGRSGSAALVPVEVDHPSFDTFAVDKYGRLYWSQAALSKWTLKEVAAVIVHEVNHVLRKHHKRLRRQYGARPSSYMAHIGNIAADLEINDDSLDGGWGDLVLPEGGCFPSNYGFPDGLLMEKYWALLHEKADEDDGDGDSGGDNDGSDKDGDGSGTDGQPGGQGGGQPGGRSRGKSKGKGKGSGPVEGPWHVGAPDGTGANVPGRNEGQMDVVRDDVARDIETYERGIKNRGNVPHGMRRWAQSRLTPPKVPWPRVLAGLVRRAVAHQRGMLTQNMRRVSKKTRMGSYVRPGWVKPVVTAAVVVDTSGSMSDQDLVDVLSEVMGIIKATGTPAQLIGCSAQAQHLGAISSAEVLKSMRVPGGGTEMGAGIELAENSRPKADVIIVLTDGDTPWPDRPPRAPVIVTLTDAVHLAKVPKWVSATVVIDKKK